MKKVVRILSLCALVAFAFAACKKNDGKVTIKASMPETTSDSRTHIDPSTNWVVWDGGDQITVFDANSTESENYLPLTLTGGVNYSTGTFLGDADFFSHLDTDSSYTAFYPVSSVEGTAQKEVLMVVPVNQTFVANSFAPNTYPMLAANDGSHFPFTSPAGLLTIRLKAKPGYPAVTVKKIRLRVGAGAKPLVGTLRFDQNAPLNYDNDDDLVIENPSGFVELDNCHLNGPLTAEETCYNFVLLKGALSGNFRVAIYDENDSELADFKGKIPDEPGIPGSGCIQAQKRVTMPLIELPIPPED